MYLNKLLYIELLLIIVNFIKTKCMKPKEELVIAANKIVENLHGNANQFVEGQIVTVILTIDSTNINVEYRCVSENNRNVWRAIDI